MARSKSVYVIVIIILLTVGLAVAGPYENSRAIAVSGGENHTLVLTADANLWACGYNGWYQLGIGDGDDTYDKKLLVRVHDGDANSPSGFLENIIAMDSGWKHSLAVDVNNHVWAFGNNEQGELGDDQTKYPDSSSPVQVHDGDMGTTSGYLENIIAVSAGRSGEYSLAIDDSNNVWAWGLNNLGQLGDGSTAFNRLTPVQVEGGEMGTTWLEGIVCISAGEAHSVAVDVNGAVWTWGENKFEELTGRGKLGVGTALEKTTTAVHVLRGAQPGTGTYLEHIVEVSAGWDHTVALEDYWPFDPNRLGRVYTWGCNRAELASDGGRLGDGTLTDSNTPVIVLSGQQDPAHATSHLKGIVAVSAGVGHCLALDVNGFVWSWGGNKYGELGNGTTTVSTTPVQVERGDNDQPLSGIVAISAAYWHSLAIDVNGTIWSWGKTDYGRLGLGDILEETARKAWPIPVVFNLNKNIYYFGIQTAIDDANDGNILEAQPGIYHEDIDFGDKTLTLKSANPSDWDVVEKTVIYGQGLALGTTHVVKLGTTQAPTQAPQISGFKITNAASGIECEKSAAPTITNCLLTGNTHRGLYVKDNADVEVVNTKIVSNGLGAGDDRAGVYCTGYDAAVTLTDCTVTDNGEPGIHCGGGDVNVTWSVITDNDGHGIHTDRSSNINIANSIIAGNGSNGVFLYGCPYNFTAEVVNNWIYNNGAADSGSGLDVYFISQINPNCRAIVRNNTIVNNATYGIDTYYGEDVDISNCIVWNNGDSASDNIHKDNGTFYVSYSCVEGGFTTGTGNISDDPCFADPNWTTDPNAGNFHIGPNSLCIDVGKPNSTEPNETDIDGEDRVILGKTTLCVDPDADELEYFWYDANELVATGPEPNVLLGPGEHVIDLIVNDGMEDSEPNSCVVTVVEAMQAEARILPRFLNRARHGRYVIGRLMLPEGVGVDDVNRDEPLLLLVGDTEIEAQRQFVLPGRRRHGGRASIFAFFDAEALLEAVGENGNIEMMLATRLMSGQAVYGTDQVRIFAPPRRPHW